MGAGTFRHFITSPGSRSAMFSGAAYHSSLPGSGGRSRRFENECNLPEKLAAWKGEATTKVSNELKRKRMRCLAIFEIRRKDQRWVSSTVWGKKAAANAFNRFLKSEIARVDRHSPFRFRPLYSRDAASNKRRLLFSHGIVSRIAALGFGVVSCGRSQPPSRTIFGLCMTRIEHGLSGEEPLKTNG